MGKKILLSLLIFIASLLLALPTSFAGTYYNHAYFVDPDTDSMETLTAKPYFTLKADNLVYFGGTAFTYAVAKVFKVSDGESTAKQYTLTPNSLGSNSFSYPINISDFGNTETDYQANIYGYVTNSNGSTTTYKVANARITVSSFQNIASPSNVTHLNTFTTYAYTYTGLVPKNGIYMAIWNNSDGVGAAQWYGMTLSANNISYTSPTIDVNNGKFAHNTGTFTIRYFRSDNNLQIGNDSSITVNPVYSDSENTTSSTFNIYVNKFGTLSNPTAAPYFSVTYHKKDGTQNGQDITQWYGNMNIDPNNSNRYITQFNISTLTNLNGDYSFNVYQNDISGPHLLGTSKIEVGSNVPILMYHAIGG